MKILYYINGMEPTAEERIEAELLGTKMFRNANLAGDKPPVDFELAGKIPKKWNIVTEEKETPVVMIPAPKKPAKKPAQWKPNA